VSYQWVEGTRENRTSRRTSAEHSRLRGDRIGRNSREGVVIHVKTIIRRWETVSGTSSLRWKSARGKEKASRLVEKAQLAKHEIGRHGSLPDCYLGLDWIWAVYAITEYFVSDTTQSQWTDR
jgi:hypothetical protein